MSGKILAVGFDSLMTILPLDAAVKPFGVELVPVERQDYNRTLGALAGLDAAAKDARPYMGGPLGGRMLVLCGVNEKLDALLPALGSAGAGPDCLKAVLTEHNRRWNPVALYGELLQERQAMRRK